MAGSRRAHVIRWYSHHTVSASFTAIRSTSAPCRQLPKMFLLTPAQRRTLVAGGVLPGSLPGRELDIHGPDDPKKKRGWIFEPDRQRARVERCWDKLEKKYEKNGVAKQLVTSADGLGRIDVLEIEQTARKRILGG